jgi:tetratricopeptide (TPR) repeat protein
MKVSLLDTPSDNENVREVHRLAIELVKNDKDEMALGLLRQALFVEPHSADLWRLLGALHLKMRNFRAGIAPLRRALSLAPNDPVVLTELAVAYGSLGDMVSSAAVAARAVAIDPKRALGWVNLGEALFCMERHQDALRAFQQAVVCDPKLAPAHVNYSGALLTNGQLRPAWEHYAWRVHVEKNSFLVTDCQAWRGQKLGPKNRLLVLYEQGLGDQILFSRLLHPKAPLDWRYVVGYLHPRQLSAWQRSFPHLEWVTGNLEAVSKQFTYAISLADLTQIFKPDAQEFAQSRMPLIPDQAQVAEVRARYEALAPGKKLVGIAWRSSNPKFSKQKSFDIRTLLPILKTPGCQFVSLQHGPVLIELAAMLGSYGLNILQDRDIDPMGPVDPYLAQIAALDAVVASSGTAVHMAGGLGRPTILIPPRGEAKFWYWGERETRSPWYPSIHICRPPRAQAWGPAIQAATALLPSLLREPP